MKKILKYLWRDKVSLGVLILTIAFAIVGFSGFLWLLILFIFRGIIWEGRYVDALNKYVTDPEYRKELGLDGNHKPDIVTIIFQIVIVLGILATAVYIIIDHLQ